MKATKAQVRERVEEVLRIRLDGAEFHDVVQYASEKEWGVGERQLWNYVRASDQLLAERVERDRDKLFNRHVAQRRSLFARALNAADYRTALAVAKDEAELHGLYPPKKVAPTNPDGTAAYDAGLAALVPELQRAVERLRQGTGEPHPGEGAGRPAGSVEGGPGADPDGGGVGPGPLAGGADALLFGSDSDAGLPPGRQEPRGSGPGTA
jgi:hypothetical protein